MGLNMQGRYQGDKTKKGPEEAGGAGEPESSLIPREGQGGRSAGTSMQPLEGVAGSLGAEGPPGIPRLPGEGLTFITQS